MNNTRLEDTGFGQAIGLQPTAKPVEWDWCQNQLKELQITELETGKNLNINKDLEAYSEFFKDHCKAKLTQLKQDKLPRLTHKMRIRYNNDTEIELNLSKPGSLLGWGDNTYKAESFIQAIEKELSKIRK
jgi:hypothetical protein